MGEVASLIDDLSGPGLSSRLTLDQYRYFTLSAITLEAMGGDEAEQAAKRERVALREALDPTA